MSLKHRDRISSVETKSPKMGWIESTFCCTPATAWAVVAYIAIGFGGIFNAVHG